ncbi:4-coumarate--CoA ligase-like [Quillaja saponaria]|uniref:4-coumarate--CoA ligase n=1 Tax=Quillaja saponaria TaxID=32244 RepID=A0AAD7KN92_QUISA|nr:4-coumarate--CoA ligase-like [Quillaja saponaria]
MASGLHKMSVSKSDVVLLLLPNSIYYPIIFLGILYLGSSCYNHESSLYYPEIKKQLLIPRFLAFTLSEKCEKIEVLGIPAIEVPEFVNSNPNPSVFYELISGNHDLLSKPVINQEDIAVILYSSGTTGASKGVILTHKNFISMLVLNVRLDATLYNDLGGENVYLAALPMFHVYGLSLFQSGLISLGSTVVIMKKFDADEVVKAIDKYKVTHFPVVPPILTALTKKAQGINGRSLQSLKQVTCGAATLSRKLIDEFVHSLPHVDFVQGYAMTECGAAFRGFNTEKFHKYSSVGLLAPNMEAKVVDLKTASFLPPLSVGELWLRGSAVMKGNNYYFLFYLIT